MLTMLPRLLRSLGSWRSEDSEVVSPLLGLMRDRLTEADALVLSGNKLSRCEIEELVSFLASAEFRPHAKTLRELRIARCGLEDRDLARIWTSLGPQARTLRILDISGNDGRIDSALVATTLGRFTQLRILNLGGSLRNCTDVSLFGESPMPFAHLTDLDLSGCALGHATVFNIASYLYDLDRSRNLVRLGLANCNLTSHEIAMLFRCMRHPGRLLTADVSQNDVEVKLEELLDCIDSSQTPAGIRLDQIEFSSEQSYVALISALRNTTALRSLSLVGTCPPGGATPVVRSTLSRLLAENGSLTALDLSGQSGRLSDARLGPGLALALATGLSRTSGSTTTNGLTSNGTGTETDGTKSALRELRVRNQGLSGCAVELATALASAASSGLAVFDCSGNGLSLDGYRYLVMALEDEERASGGICSLVRFPITAADHHHAVVLAKRQLGIEEPATAVDCGSHAGISRSGPTTGDWHRRATRRGAGSVLSAPDKTAKRGSRVFGVTRRVLSKGGVGHGNNGCNWRDGGGIGIGLGIMSSRTSTDMKRTAAAAEAGGSASRTIDAAWADMVTRLQATLERNRQRQMAGSWPGAQEMLQLPELDGEYYDVYSPDGRLYDDEVQTYYCHSDDDSGSGGRRPWQADVGRPLPQSRMPRARDAGVDDGDDEPEAPYHVNEFITMVPFAAAPLS